jgi:hypothetical protein
MRQLSEDLELLGTHDLFREIVAHNLLRERALIFRDLGSFEITFSQGQSALCISSFPESVIPSRWSSILDISQGVNSTNLGCNIGRKIPVYSAHIISW